jgi:hypothetical protein
MTWIKSRSNAQSHAIFDTQRGVNRYLFSDNNDVSTLFGSDFGVTSFNSNGFTVKGGTGYLVNQSGTTYTSWTFRKQPKFFDMVTYTGDGQNSRPVSHNLGSTPGCIIIKCLSAAGFTSNWVVWHRSLSASGFLQLNTTSAEQISTKVNQVTSTSFNLSNDSDVNGDTRTYIAYIFAHDAGGFGLTGTDNVISCGSFTTDGSGNAPAVNLGYEPQWILVKSINNPQSWIIYDNMRSWSVTGSAYLLPNSSSAEVAQGAQLPINATGFGPSTGSLWLTSTNYMYITIRRGPMKTPTSGTQVYNAIARSGTSATATVTEVGFAPDLVFTGSRSGTGHTFIDRLRGAPLLITHLNNAEANYSNEITSFDMNGITLGNNSGGGYTNLSGQTYVPWFFRRAPGFFDIVCYTGTLAVRTIAHNLGVPPEMMIIKRRESIGNWPTYHSAYGPTETAFFNLSNNADPATPNKWNSTAPTSSVFSLDGANDTNGLGGTFVAYLFASCPGVSKVGSYVGSGTTKQIDCGFTTGARFVMIKRYDDVDPGAWYVWDSTRGIVAGNDPYLIINSTANEVTNTDYIDTFNAGFEISSTAPAAINGSGGLFIFLAIA